jgi:hypothetical protein
VKIREKRDEMLLTLALLEQLEKDDELKEFESYERRENNEGKRGAPGEKGHVFSEGHRERMEQLFKMAALQEKKKKRRRWMKKAAAGMAACLAVSVYMGFTSSAFRTPVLNFFTEVRETYSELLVDKDDKDGVTEHFQEYEPDYVVKGFYVVAIKEKKREFLISYESEQGQWYDFYYYEEPHNSQVDTENLVQTEVEINGRKGTLYQKEGYNQTVVRSTAGQFGVVGNISAEEEEKILESVKIQDIELKNTKFY